MTETGKITLSVDGLGTLSSSGIIQVEKPAGATVRHAYLAAASMGTSGRMLVNGDIKVNGQDVTWDRSIPASLSCWNHWADVTALLKPLVDAAPVGRVNITVDEVGSGGIDGEILVVVFDDPARMKDATVILLFGAQNTSGDAFSIGTVNPVDLSDPSSRVDFSLGISYGFQTPATTGQYSTIDVNGMRMTSSAGGQDDGEPANGALLTVGGLDDSNANPTDPNAAPSNFDTDDELYDLKPFMHPGDVTINVNTFNPSSDDNIFFGALYVTTAPVVVGEALGLSPNSATTTIHSQFTLTGTLQDDHGIRLPGKTVTFTVLSGPNTGTTAQDVTDASGQARFTYTGNQLGTDVIGGEFLNSQGQVQVSQNLATIEWVAPPNLPPVCSVTGPSSAAVCAPIEFDASGSSDPEGGPLTFAWDFGDGQNAVGSGLSNVTHVYDPDTEEGPRLVRLQITDAQGATCSREFAVNVQAPLTKIAGEVRTQKGKAIEDAEARAVTSAGTALSEWTPTKRDGSYELMVRPGLDYAVLCRKKGFWDQSATGLLVCPATGRKVNFTLIEVSDLDGIVRIEHTGFAPDKSTTITVTVRAPKKSTYYVTFDCASDGHFDPSDGRLEFGPMEAGKIDMRSFVLTERLNRPALRPISVNLNLYRKLGPTPVPLLVDTDVLDVVVDSPLHEPGASALEATMARSLLAQHQPAFLLNAGEPYVPHDVDVMLERATMAFSDLDKMTFPAAVNRGLLGEAGALSTPQPITQPYLDLYGDGFSSPCDKRNILRPICEYAQIEPSRPVVYGTAVQQTGQDGAERIYLSYWCFFFYEQWTCAEHEGDWEGVTVVLKRNQGAWGQEKVAFVRHPLPPLLGTCSAGLEVVRWEDVDKLNVNGRDVARVYVAMQAHGTYPHAGTTCDLGTPRVCQACCDVHLGGGRWVLPGDAPRDFDCRGCEGLRSADLVVIPRFDTVGKLHPGRWALFAGNYGFTPGITGIAPPIGPPFKGRESDGRWSSPAAWLGDLRAEAVDAVATTPTAMAPRIEHESNVGGAGPSGAIELAAGVGAWVRVELYDIAGRLVRTLHGRADAAGILQMSWDGRSESGRILERGLYFYRGYSAEIVVGTGKIALLR